MSDNPWKDMPFSEQPKAHPSSWEGEAKISRITISRLKARVAELEARIDKAREEALREASRECAYACGCQDAVLALIEKDEPPKAKKPNLVGTGVQMGILNKNPGS